MVATCDATFLRLCLTRPSDGQNFTIFGFPQFVEALALLLVVYNIFEPRAKFRAQTTPIPLLPITFASTVSIGIGTLLTDVWIDQRWPALPWGLSRVEIEGSFGTWFLVLVCTWSWFAFLQPPVFSRFNSRRFGRALYRVIVRGSAAELPSVISELVRSATSLIQTVVGPPVVPGRRVPQPSEAATIAGEILLALGHRKVCRYVVSDTPELAIVLMESAAEALERPSFRSRFAPLGHFARNVTVEALLNPDSPLYHESSGFDSGLMGYIKPFSGAMYGHYRLVEQLAADFHSPLDVECDFFEVCTPQQFDKYCKIVLITCRAYIDLGVSASSPALHRAFGNVKRGLDRLYTVNGSELTPSRNQEVEKLQSVVHFCTELIDHIEKKGDYPLGRVRRQSPNLPPGHGDERDGLIDMIVSLLSSTIEAASHVYQTADNAWSVQYLSVWTSVYGVHNSPVWRMVRRKLSRHLYEHVKQLERFPNFQAARIFGFCLHVLGIHLGGSRHGFDRADYALRQAVLLWARRNYMTLRAANLRVAEACLAGNITFDPRRRRLVRTYNQGLNDKPPQNFLPLDRARKLKPS